MKHAALFMLVVSAAAGGAALAAPPRSFEFDGSFEPAFHAPSHLMLQSSGASAKLIIQIGDSSKSVPVDPAVAADFLHDVTSLRFAKSKPQEGLDGCNVNLYLSVDGKDAFASKVWSPTKASAPTEDALLRALYKVTEHSRIPSQEADYLEQLYLYFDNIQPHWKVLDRKPFTVRFNEAFWVDDFPAFRALVASLPRDREAVIDITMLEGSGLYAGEVTKRVCDEFVKATEERAVKWRAGKGWSELLLKAGLPEDRMIPPTPSQTPVEILPPPPVHFEDLTHRLPLLPDERKLVGSWQISTATGNRRWTFEPDHTYWIVSYEESKASLSRTGRWYISDTDMALVIDPGKVGELGIAINGIDQNTLTLAQRAYIRCQRPRKPSK